MNTTKVVLTDFDGVIRHWPSAVTASIEDRHGLPRGSLAKTAFDPSILDDAITGRMTDAEWRNEVARRLEAETDAATARSAVSAWSTSRGVVDQGALQALQAARSVAALGLVTNATTRLDDDLARLGLSDAFDFVVNSSAVGCAKPSRCFYEHAARRCGCERGAVLFVDDRPENVEAAIDFGFHGHMHRDPRTLERLLREWNLTDKDVPGASVGQMNGPVLFRKAELSSFCEANGIRRLAIFGSALRDDFGPESDIDVLVEFKADRIPGLLGLAGMELELSKLFRGRRVDLRTLEDLSPYFRQEVLATAEVQYAQG